MASSQEATQAFSSGQLEVDLPEFVSWLESGEHRATHDPDFKPEYVRVFVHALRHRRYLYVSSIPGDSPATKVHANVLAISQDTDSIGYEIHLYGDGRDDEINARVVFDPSSDDLILTNSSPVYPMYFEGDGGSASLSPARSGSIAPGTWKLMCQRDTPLLQIQVLPRRHWVEDDLVANSHKRQIQVSEKGSKRQRDNSSSVVSRSAETAVAPVHHPLLTLTQGQTACLVGQGKKEAYTITHTNRLVDTKAARLYTATHSSLTSPVVVKVIKSLPKQAVEVRRSAEIWLREVNIHARVKHHVGQSALGALFCFVHSC
ncbi:unnamed protein product [Discula destructiva]